MNNFHTCLNRNVHFNKSECNQCQLELLYPGKRIKHGNLAKRLFNLRMLHVSHPRPTAAAGRIWFDSYSKNKDAIKV